LSDAEKPPLSSKVLFTERPESPRASVRLQRALIPTLIGIGALQMGAGMRICGKLGFLVFAWLVAFALAPSEQAGAASEVGPAKQLPVKQAEAKESPHPAMWRIVNGKSTVYLLGSVHLLPVGFSWRTPEIDQAIAAADVFAFEANIDFGTTELHYFIDNHGYLPRGQTLHAMLSPVALKQYAALIVDAHIDPNKVDYLRPGLAGIMLEKAYMATHALGTFGPGVDVALINYAKSHGKELRYLESLQSQFEMMDKLGGGGEVKELEKLLANLGKDDADVRTLFGAWTQGDLSKLASLEDKDPGQRVLVLDNRNKAWLPQIEAMLKEPKTILVTVGAAHLAGPQSVISLLCAKGWKVERVQTGPTPPPLGCGA
jgi:uncharacterized protein YbaP (TraB family)